MSNGTREFIYQVSFFIYDIFFTKINYTMMILHFYYLYWQLSINGDGYNQSLVRLGFHKLIVKPRSKRIYSVVKRYIEHDTLGTNINRNA